jgi:ABC-type lipoprotein release transport system permease subunit
MGVQAVARSWKTYQPEMVEYAGLMRATQWITLGLVFGMAVFGVANTMLMATFERRKEFAVLLALGCGPGLVVRSVLAEAVALSALSLAVGVVIALPILVWWHAAPPDMGWLYGGFTMGGGFMRPILRVEWPTAVIFAAGAALVLVALLAALWPAVRSGRVPPADALAGR